MKTPHILILGALAALAACGGSFDPEDGAPVAGTEVVSTLLDDEGRLMPSLPRAQPDDPLLRARGQRFATTEQAAQLEAALGERVLRVDLDGPGGVTAALALGLTASARDMAGLPDGVPVLVRGHDLRMAVQVAGQLAQAGLTGVWVVRS